MRGPGAATLVLETTQSALTIAVPRNIDIEADVTLIT
jgi:hypothetical protein